jgi:hypothetical protein
MLKDKIEKKKHMSLKKKGGRTKQTQANPLKPMLMSQTCNPWNLRSRLNKKSQSLTNLILKDGIKKY